MLQSQLPESLMPLALAVAKTSRLAMSHKITPDEYRARMATVREACGDADTFNVVKGRGLCIATNGEA
jgi:hypothetical protein